MSPTLPDPHHPTSEELFAYRDGELPADRRTLLEAHVLACAQCSERLDEMSTAEAELRHRGRAAGEDYFESMTESVMAKIGYAGTEAREDAVAPASRGYVDVPRVERRRPDSAAEDPEPRRRLHLPWIGIGGSLAAAVAVVIVAVVLFRGQNEWVRAPRPAVLGQPREAARADSSASGEGQAGGITTSGARSRGAVSAPSIDRTPSLEKAQLKKPDRAASPDSRGAPPSLGAIRSERDAGLKDQAAEAGSQVGAVSSQPFKAEPEGRHKISIAQNAVPPAASAAPTPGGAYSNVLRAYRLPPLWNPSVPGDALARAETDLRYLYQAGQAGGDSARIRLYLAEAERARLTDPSNAEAVESISHHYRRAISLAGDDAALAATARRRLAEFEQEMTRARGTQP